MLTDGNYNLCLPILNDETLGEEEKTDKLEELLQNETDLRGKALEDVILGALWRFRDSKNISTASTSSRQITGRSSPAPWQIPRATTPATSPSLVGASPVSTFGFGAFPTNLARAKSSTASPFASPRPSPRLAFTSPIPHSPNLNSYEFTEPPVYNADYGDLGSESVDWLVGEAASSRPTSSGAGSSFESGLNAAAAPWTQTTQVDMSPYDMLRSIMGETKTDAEIEAALEANAFDLSAAISSIMGGSDSTDMPTASAVEGQILIGKSTQSNPTPSTAVKSSVICKYWLATGTCLRADCRYSHEFGSTLCRYWMMGSCLAGDTCVFSHDPGQLMTDLSLNNSPTSVTASQPALQIQDYASFPALQASSAGQWNLSHGNTLGIGSSSPGLGTRSLSNTSFASLQSGFASTASPRSYSSRPTSRHSSRAPTPSIPQVDDTEAFPTLGSQAPGKSGKKHHGKRGGHGHSNSIKDGSPGLLADAIRMNSSSNAPMPLRKGLMKSRSYVGRTETNIANNTIPSPERIPWLEMGERANQTYLKARQEALKHGGLRNKFLQSAAQAWNRNDARAAKALSLRGQSENDLMRKAHREAARFLYEGCNNSADAELYIDLHGLHPEEAVAYLEQILLEHRTSKRPVYAITGTSHHSKNGKDKVAKAVRQWLVEWKYVFREFIVPSDRSGNTGSILGIDATAFDKSLLSKQGTTAGIPSSDRDAGFNGASINDENNSGILASETAISMTKTIAS